MPERPHDRDRELRDLLRAYKPTRRDRIAVRLANGVLRVVAGREYRTILWCLVQSSLWQLVQSSLWQLVQSRSADREDKS